MENPSLSNTPIEVMLEICKNALTEVPEDLSCSSFLLALAGCPKLKTAEWYYQTKVLPLLPSYTLTLEKEQSFKGYPLSEVKKIKHLIVEWYA
jgi:hypothetical protein